MVDDIIVFLLLSAVCMGVWTTIAHIDMYFMYKEKYIKEEYLKGFTFYRYTVDELKRLFTGKGLM